MAHAEGKCGLLLLSVAALVGLSDAIVPAERILVEYNPEKTEAEGQGGEQQGSDACAERGAAGIVVIEGAEGDFGVVHAWGCIGEGEKEELIEQPHGEERDAGSDEGDAAMRQAGGTQDKDQVEQQERGEGEGAVDQSGHGAVFTITLPVPAEIAEHDR